MKKLFLFWFMVITLLFEGCGRVEQTEAKKRLFPVQLTCNFRRNPLGIESEKPYLGWRLTIKDTTKRDMRQTAYRILVSSDKAALQKEIGDLWDSGKTPSSKQFNIEYGGKKIKSARRVYWKVRVWDDRERPSAWSDIVYWETGLLTEKAWDDSRWIAYERLEKEKQIVPGIPHTKDKGLPRDVIPQFRKGFKIERKIKYATLFIAGLGQYEAYLNGVKIGRSFLDPGWTNYRKSVLYSAYDVGGLLKKGDNALGVILGNGMFFIPQERYTKFVIAYGYPQMRAKLIITYADGSRETIGTDRTFKTSASAITFSSIYGGEDYDGTLEQTGWKKAGFDDSAWKNAIEIDGPGGKLKAQFAPPLKVMATFMPVQISAPRKNIWVYDMRQNASAIPKITVKGKRGDEVTIIPGELLDENGMVTQRATGSPYLLKYRLKGGGIEDWQPLFTYYGYRYLQVEGAIPAGRDNPGNLPVIVNLQSLHTRNSAGRVGNFSCSNELFNRIYHLIDWGMRSNMASVLTDCPHREKLGWLEQAHLMSASIRYNYNVPNLLKKIVNDMREAQLEDGLIPDIAPEYPIFSGGFRDSPEWGSAFVILPWYIYQWYGDRQPLRENYNAMKRYVAYLKNKSDENIVSHGLGDWFDIGPKDPGPAQLTPKALTATAIYYYDVKILEKTAAFLGFNDDEKMFATQAHKIKKAFNAKFFNPQTKQYAQGSQTANAMPLFMGLVNERDREAVIDNLVKSIKSGDYKLTAGDIGYRYLLRVLEAEGYSDVIFKMNNRSDVPGYGYQLFHGATALTESWQAYRNVSNNHMMLGHLMEWFYSGLAGIRVDFSLPIAKQIIIKPQICGDINWVKAKFNTPAGAIESRWRRQGNLLFMDIAVPPNARAVVYIPADNKNSVKEGGKSIAQTDGILKADYNNNCLILSVASGYYHFQSILVK